MSVLMTRINGRLLRMDFSEESMPITEEPLVTMGVTVGEINWDEPEEEDTGSESLLYTTEAEAFHDWLYYGELLAAGVPFLWNGSHAYWLHNAKTDKDFTLKQFAEAVGYVGDWG